MLPVLLAGLMAIGSGCDDPPPPDDDSTDAGGLDARDRPDGRNDTTTDGGNDAPTDGGNDDGGEPFTDGGNDSGNTVPRVRFMNALADDKAGDNVFDPFIVDLHLGDTRVFGDVPQVAPPTGYVTVTEGKPLVFSMRTPGDGGAEAGAWAQVDAGTIAADEELLVVATGLATEQDVTAPWYPKLLALKESASTPAAGHVGMRFISAGQLSFGTYRLSTGEGDVISTIESYVADDVREVRADVSSLVVTEIWGATNQASTSFHVPAGVLREGKSYFVVNTGWDVSGANYDDESRPGLWLVPFSRESEPVFLARDPYVSFGSALVDEVSSGGTTTRKFFEGKLDVRADALNYKPVREMQTLATPKWIQSPLGTVFAGWPQPVTVQLPATKTGHALSFITSGDGGEVVLAGAQTGPLEAGKVYLAMMSGVKGATDTRRPILKVLPTPFTHDRTKVELGFVNASPTSPASGVDFGTMAWDEGQGKYVTSLVVGAAAARFGEHVLLPGEFKPHVVDFFGAKRWLPGVRSAGQTTPWPFLDMDTKVDYQTSWIVLAGDVGGDVAGLQLRPNNAGYELSTYQEVPAPPSP